MEYADGGFHAFVAQVRVEVRQVDRHHQAFVRHHPLRQTGHIKTGLAIERFFSQTAGVEQLNGELGFIHIRRRRDKHLLKTRQAGQRNGAQASHYWWALCAKANNRQTLSGKGLLNGVLLLFENCFVQVHEQHTHGITGRQGNTCLGRDGTQERVRLLQ